MASRGCGVAVWILAVIFAPVYVGCLWLAGSLFWSVIARAPRGGSATGPQVLLFAVLLFVAPTFLAWILLRSLVTKRHFFERGAMQIAGRRLTHAIRYDSVRLFTFKVVRQYVNGAYAGTSATVKLIGKDALRSKDTGQDDARSAETKIALTCGYKAARAAKFFTLSGGTFGDDAELEVVKTTIADIIAQRHARALAEGAEVPWCSGHIITPTGLRPKKGKRKGMVVPFAEMDRYGANAGLLHLYARGEPKPFLRVFTGESNFWPGFTLLNQILSAIHGDDAGRASETLAEASIAE